MVTKTRLTGPLLALWIIVGCGGAQSASDTESAESEGRYGALDRARFNQVALRLDLGLFWAADDDDDGQVDPAEVRSLLFYPGDRTWVDGEGRFTEAFDRAYAAMVAATLEGPPSDERTLLVLEELASASPTLVETDLRALPADHRAFAEKMLRVAGLVDWLYARQTGMAALAARESPTDAPSRSLFRRNWGPRCLAPTTERNPACSAIAGAPKQYVDVYPEALQADEGFCAALEAREDKETLLAPFVVVREREGALVPIPYHDAYAEEVRAISAELRSAADALTDPNEEPLRVYLRAAAQSFLDDDWVPADEAWSRMNARSSKWYVRVGPDEVYWEPCSRKAGYHLTFALVDTASLEWQARLTPLQNDMERALAALVPGAYDAREVSFSMPDFIAIVVNAGDDRNAFGATIGQSLPNWGPVADEGRGRTVAMTNLYTDPDSNERRRTIAASMFDSAAMASFTTAPQPGLLSTILHEATHNLGPAHEYRVDGKTSDEAFGGEMASMLEELKAQSGALFLLTLLKERGIIDEIAAREAYLDSMVWALGHVSRGMYTADGHRKAYSQLAAVQIGFLSDQGALHFDPNALAANGEDRGAFAIDYERMPAASEALMREVMRILAEQDIPGAQALAARHVDGDTVPQSLVAERYLRFPRQSFVYSARL